METVWLASALALGAKMAATAVVVVLASLVVERVGPLVGAMVATLPVSAGPALVFLAAEQGAAFLAASAPASLAGLGSTACFVTVYAALARRHGRLLSTLGALAAWVAAAVALRWLAPGLWAATAADAAIFAACSWRVAGWRHARIVGRARRSRWDVPVRAGGAMLLVAAVVVLGRLLGPGAAGLAALAPVVMTSLAVLLHPRIGGPGAAAVLANALPGLMGNAVAVVVIGLTAVPLGAAPALLLALAICLAWNGAVVALGR